MPRDPRKVVRREIKPDYKYGSVLVSRFINKINFQGKKALARNIVYKAFDLVAEKTKSNPLEIFNQAVEKGRPLLEVRPRRVGGATYQVPVEVPYQRGQTLALRWIIQYARERKGKPMYIKLAEQLIETARGEGPVIKKKETTHKMAEANQAFAYYRW